MQAQETSYRGKGRALLLRKKVKKKGPRKRERVMCGCTPERKFHAECFVLMTFIWRSQGRIS